MVIITFGDVDNLINLQALKFDISFVFVRTSLKGM